MTKNQTTGDSRNLVKVVPLSADLMTGAESIAEFMFGDTSEANRRRVYHASDKLGLPTFKLGGTICARRSTILAWIERQEARS